jgi:hypothetical protein
METFVSPPVEAVQDKAIELFPTVAVTGSGDVRALKGVADAEPGVALLPWAFTATTR